MQQFSGAWPTLLTPYQPDRNIDWVTYQIMLEWYLSHPIGGIYANCLSSEMYHLTQTERLALTRAAVEISNGRVPVVSTGNFGKSIDEHVQSCLEIQETGVDAVMLTVPEFIDDDHELLDYYLRLAEEIQSPLGLYECPVPRSFHLNPALVGKLARTGRFVAFKETSCDLGTIQAHLAEIADTPLAMLQANTPLMLDTIRAGAQGSMTIAAIWLPDLVSEVIQKARQNDPGVDVLHGKLCALKLMQRANHPMGTRFLMQKRGVPIELISRNPQLKQLSGETITALNYAALSLFDSEGQLANDY